ncbi:hypothetical protein DSM25558_3914 [Agrobacterium sp. DSM 25558]|nr:hypothetical protein DSM25558_3914 [Agrobacterium sp. DSM 25558]
MQMYSSDIFISSKVFFVAQSKAEAAQMANHAKQTALTVPENDLFTDRDFKDPTLATLTFATTFNFWGLLDDKRLSDDGPLGSFLKSSNCSTGASKYRLITGMALVGATVYIKAESRVEAEETFRLLESRSFQLETNANGIGLLGITELNGICFADNFRCHILEHDSLKYRGSWV